MKKHRWLFVLGCTTIMTACSTRTPDCADPETIETLSEIVEGYVAETVSIFNKEQRVDFSVDVPYQFTAIRVIDYDERSDTYSCQATIETEVDKTWAGNHNLMHRTLREKEFEYRVYSVADSDGNRATEVEYDAQLSLVPRSASIGLLQEQFLPIKEKREREAVQRAMAEENAFKDEMLSRLEEIRANGVWSEEHETVAWLIKNGVQVPDPTPEQVAARDYGDRSQGSPAYCASRSLASDACIYIAEKYGAERRKWLPYEAQLDASWGDIRSCFLPKMRAHGSYPPGARMQVAYERECRDRFVPKPAGLPNPVDHEECVDVRIELLRREIGEEATITSSQLEEFEAECRQYGGGSATQ